MGKKKVEEEGEDTFLRKKSSRKKNQCYHNTSDIISNSDICRKKRNSFSSEVKIIREII